MIRIGIVGTGGMARAHARAYQNIRGCRIAAACDLQPKRAREFAAEFDVPDTYTDVEEMLAETPLDAVSVVTSDPGHSPVSLAAIRHGKHVLCEKPLATTHPEARKMAAAATRKGVINMVNLSYRNSAALQKTHALVESGAIGRVTHFEASYLQGWLVGKHWGDWRTLPHRLWRLSTAHGSRGVLGDLGVHIFDFASYGAGDIAKVDARLKTFPKAKGDTMRGYTLDANDSVVATVELTNGALGTIHTTRWGAGHVNSLLLRIFGTKGGIVVDLDRSYDEIQVSRGADVDKPKWRTVRCPRVPDLYQRLIQSIRTGVNDQPDFARGAAIQKILDACVTSSKTGKAVKV
jgi:predicted dehydrogenase